MKTSFRFGALVCTVVFSLLLLPSGFSQGPLTPPGAPAPTMKSLDQVEARTPIDATNTPGDTDSEAVISAAGSYYLTGNLHVAKTNGIHVTATGVTINLNGFQIDRASGTPNMAIRIETAAQNCAIKNGSIIGPFP